MAIALFARAPVPSRVKSRLIGPLTPDHACDLHRALVLDCWDALRALGGELFLYTDQDHPEWRALAGDDLRLQQGDDLGRRMLRCFEELGPALIVGGDTVGLTPELVAPWREKLVTADAVLGPAPDGGYWSIGCRLSHPRMFEGVEWSSPWTLEQTVAALERCGMTVAFLDSCWDMDRPEDLEGLFACGPRVRLWLDRWRGGSGS
jgi:hypothetical protein